MKNTENIFDLLQINKTPKKEIQLTHCLQIPSNEMSESRHLELKKDCRYIYLGSHGRLDKILRIEPDNNTQFFLGHWNDGVINNK